MLNSWKVTFWKLGLREFSVSVLLSHTKTHHQRPAVRICVQFQAQRTRRSTRRSKTKKARTTPSPPRDEPERCGPLRARQAITVTDKEGIDRTLVCLKHKTDYIWTELDSKRRGIWGKRGDWVASSYNKLCSGGGWWWRWGLCHKQYLGLSHRAGCWPNSS